MLPRFCRHCHAAAITTALPPPLLQPSCTASLLLTAAELPPPPSLLLLRCRSRPCTGIFSIVLPAIVVPLLCCLCCSANAATALTTLTPRCRCCLHAAHFCRAAAMLLQEEDINKANFM
jgi:hypothetical protein